MNYTNNEIIKYLKDYGIKPSNIRLKVLKFLLENRVHPSADDIYTKLIDEIPTLSKTSIYNTLNLFVENGLVKELYLDDKESRYDINTSPHGHFKCIKCQRVYDFPIVEEPSFNLDGFVIKSKSINYYGICKKCNM